MKIKKLAQDILELEEVKSFVYLKIKQSGNIIKQLDTQIANCEKKLTDEYFRFVAENPLGVVKDGMYLISCLTHDDNPEQTVWLVLGDISITVMDKYLEIVKISPNNRSILDEIQYRLHVLSKKFYMPVGRK